VTTRYSSFALLREGLRGRRGWRPAWAKAVPQPAYDAVIIGGGGHGLATAFYLAKNHGMSRVACSKRAGSVVVI
jgi:sarcosine oxidase subunit beta